MRARLLSRAAAPPAEPDALGAPPGVNLKTVVMRELHRSRAAVLADLVAADAALRGLAAPGDWHAREKAEKACARCRRRLRVLTAAFAAVRRLDLARCPAVGDRLAEDAAGGQGGRPCP